MNVLKTDSAGEEFLDQGDASTCALYAMGTVINEWLRRRYGVTFNRTLFVSTLQAIAHLGSLPQYLARIATTRGYTYQQLAGISTRGTDCELLQDFINHLDNSAFFTCTTGIAFTIRMRTLVVHKFEKVFRYVHKFGAETMCPFYLSYIMPNGASHAVMAENLFFRRDDDGKPTIPCFKCRNSFGTDRTEVVHVGRLEFSEAMFILPTVDRPVSIGEELGISALTKLTCNKNLT